MGRKISSFFAISIGVCLVILLVWVIARQVREHHMQDDPMLHMLREMLIPVHPAMATLKLYKGDKSYTINKSKTFLCLSDRTGEYYDLNMLCYVLLHELAHVINHDIGHTESFYKVFDGLLEKATALGVYSPSIPVVKDYCE